MLDLQATPLIQQRLRQVDSVVEQLFVLMMLGDDRVIAQTFIYGECQYSRR